MRRAVTKRGRRKMNRQQKEKQKKMNREKTEAEPEVQNADTESDTFLLCGQQRKVITVKKLI